MSQSKNTLDQQSAGLSTRTKVVWSSLLLSMALATGIMMLAGGELPTRDAQPLLAPGDAPASLESVFVTDEPLDQSKWQAIVIYHSADAAGSASSIAQQHRDMGLRGLGYHFVIGNGVGQTDGSVEIGYRWLDQASGAHATGDFADWYDQHSIGICLVGNGARRPFSDRQIDQLLHLVRALQRELRIPAGNIKLHSDIAPTEAPGWHFPEAAFREQLDGSV